jgi:hypothetical protein
MRIPPFCSLAYNFFIHPILFSDLKSHSASESIANIDEYRWTLENVYGTLFLVMRAVDGACVDEGSEVGMDRLKLWDQYTKLLVRQSPQSLVSFLVPSAVFEQVVDRELQVPSLMADGLYQVIWRGEKIMLHVEFQKSRDTNMGRRMWLYNALANMHTELPVRSVVIYLVKETSLVESPYVIPLPDGQPTQRLDFETIKLWEIPSEFFEQQGLVGLFPLLPLTKDGKKPETIQRMIDVLRKAREDDLLALGYAFASLVFTAEGEREWLIERFSKVQDILEGSWVFQQLIKKGKKEGLGEGLLQIVEISFPTLLARAKRVVEGKASLEQLRTMFTQLYRANTVEEARSVLQAHEEEQ